MKRPARFVSLFEDHGDDVVRRFQAGDSMHTIAKQKRLTVQTVERLLRRAMVNVPRGAEV